MAASNAGEPGWDTGNQLGQHLVLMLQPMIFPLYKAITMARQSPALPIVRTYMISAAQAVFAAGEKEPSVRKYSVPPACYADCQLSP